MSAIAAIRSGLAKVISQLDSSKRAGTFTHRLVQIISPEKVLKSSHHSTPRAIPLKERAAAHLRATDAVHNLEHKLRGEQAAKAALSSEPSVEVSKQKIPMGKVIQHAFKMVERGESYEARLFLTDALKESDTTDSLSGSIEKYLEERANRNHGTKAINRFKDELQAAKVLAKDHNLEPTEVGSLQNVAYMQSRLKKAGDWADNYYQPTKSTSSIVHELLSQIQNDHPYRARKVIEKSLEAIDKDQRAAFKSDLESNVDLEYMPTIYGAACVSLFKTQMEAAYNKVVLGTDYVELSNDWYEKNREVDVKESKLYGQELDRLLAKEKAMPSGK